MAALIGRMWRSAFTHVLRDVSNVSPRIQPSNSLKNSVYIDYLSCHMKKKLNGKMYSFFFLHQFEFPQKLLSIDQMSPTAVLFIESCWKYRYCK